MNTVSSQKFEYLVLSSGTAWERLGGVVLDMVFYHGNRKRSIITYNVYLWESILLQCHMPFIYNELQNQNKYKKRVMQWWHMPLFTTLGGRGK